MSLRNLLPLRKPVESEAEDPIYMDDMIARGKESLERRKQRRLESRDKKIITAVQSRVIDIHDASQAVNDNQAELYNVEFLKNDAFIIPESYIVIPEYLRMSYPFFLIGSGLKKIRLSKILELSQRDRDQAIAMLPESGIIITSREFEFEIERNERIELPSGHGSLNDYIRSPNSLRMQELK